MVTNISAKLANAIGRSVTILGSTGSVGASTLDVIAHARALYGTSAFPLEAITAQRNVDLLALQARAYHPRVAVIADAGLGNRLKDALGGTGVEARLINRRRIA